MFFSIYCIIVEILDSKEVTDTSRQFLKNWQANKEAARKRKQASRQTSG